jgi:hypothetical protein
MIYEERPAPLALIGGLVVLVAVASEGVAGLRRAKRAAALS